MKIVHINWSLAFGGIETMLINIANGQADKGHEVYVIIVNTYEDTLINTFNRNVNVILLKRKRQSYSISFLFRIDRILRTVHPDVVHLHSSRLYYAILSQKMRKRTYYTLHALPHGNMKFGFIHNMFPLLKIRTNSNVAGCDKVKQIFAISQAVHDNLIKNYKQESIVIPNGVLTSNFNKRPQVLFKTQLHIVQVSRLDHQSKGQDLLIEAASKLKGKVKIDFIGDGDSQDFLINLAKNLKVEKYVNFLGKQSQDYIAKTLCNYDLFVQASRWEGFGLTVAEAMAAQVPVLVASGQGPAEVTCNDKYGWVFENGNSEDLQKQIVMLMNNYNEAIVKAKLAKQYVDDTYDVSVTVDKYLANY